MATVTAGDRSGGSLSYGLAGAASDADDPEDGMGKKFNAEMRDLVGSIPE